MNDALTDKEGRAQILRMAANVVAAYLGRNALASQQIPEIIQTVYASLNRVGGNGNGSSRDGLKPAISVKKSVHADYIVCLEDGKKLKMLKRHLRTTFNMTPDEYRSKWGLPSDYPMVAASYAAQRSAFAKKIGLGRKPVDGGAKRGKRAKSAR